MPISSGVKVVLSIDTPTPTFAAFYSTTTQNPQNSQLTDAQNLADIVAKPKKEGKEQNAP